MIKVKIIIGMAVKGLIERTEVSISNSLIRFTEGGALIFAAAARNHHRVNVGRRAIMPFVRNKLRVLVVW